MNKVIHIGIDQPMRYFPLTIGKVYDTNDNIDYLGKAYIGIHDDIGQHCYYPINFFIPLEEYRANQIEKII